MRVHLNLPLPFGERRGPTAKRWGGEGVSVHQFRDLNPLTLPLLRNGSLPLSNGERENSLTLAGEGE